MIALDTLRIRIPSDVLTHLEPSAFRSIEETDGGTGSVRRMRKLSGKVIKETCGLNGVEVGEDIATVEVSGKILGEMYPQGITLNTVDRLVDGINATRVLSVDGARLMDTAEVLRCDVCANLPVEDIRASLNTLRIITLNERYHTRPYNGTGIVITREAKRSRERLTFYDKHSELLRKNRKWVAAGVLDPDPFKGMLRAETNIGRFVDLRSLFLVEDPRLLLDVLSSEQNPLLTVFERVTDHRLIHAAGDSFAELCKMRGGAVAVAKRLGWERIFEKCGMEWEVVRTWIKAQYWGRSKPSRIIVQARREFDRMLSERGQAVDVSGLNELHGLLRIAA